MDSGPRGKRENPEGGATHCSLEGCLWLAWDIDSGEAVEGGGGIPNSHWGSGGVGRYADTGD